MDAASRHLLFHGVVMLLWGLLCGAPYGSAIVRGKPPEVVHSWRVAHASLPMGAAVVMAVAAVLTYLPVDARLRWGIVSLFIASIYAFCVALTLAPIVRHRGLVWAKALSARVVYLGNLLGALTSLLAAAGLLYAAGVAL